MNLAGVSAGRAYSPSLALVWDESDESAYLETTFHSILPEKPGPEAAALGCPNPMKRSTNSQDVVIQAVVTTLDLSLKSSNEQPKPCPSW